MIVKISVDEHGLLGDRILQDTQVMTSTEGSLHIFVVLEIAQDRLYYILLFVASDIKDVSISFRPQ